MPYILGAFGAQCTQNYQKKLTNIATQHAADHTFESMALKNGIVLAGYKPEEKYRYNHIMPLHTGQGMLVGKIFDNNQHKPAQFTDEQIHALMSDSTYLSSHYWGRYVGALVNKTTQTLTLVRDPQGLSTIFYSLTPDGIVFSNELALLYEALEIKPSINISYFTNYLIPNNQALSSTPFENIQELLPGTALNYTINGSYNHTLLWNPAPFHGNFIANENEFEEQLLATLRSCTQAWVGDAPGVCVKLSGGTDSSGIMLLLHDILPADKKLIAVNYIDSKVHSSNEIEFAQEMADICNAPLHFTDWQTVSLLDKLPINFLPNRPSMLLLFNNMHNQINEHALHNNCPELMDGQGGDHVFCSQLPPYALADYWLQRGLRGWTQPLQELSGACRMPWSSIIGNNIQAVSNFYRKKLPIEHHKLAHLDKNVLQELKQDSFYLDNELKKIYPGKAQQIKSLCHAIDYAERDQTHQAICRTHPLLSQPVIELALQIPTYQSFKDGYDRIFFRRAVSRIKKTKALWRRAKGHTNGSMTNQCAQHAPAIRDIILNGKLTASGIVDTAWFNKEIATMQHRKVDSLWAILHVLTSELWLNQWNL
jgi:asparagine synthase (glutamine-hydrolysing)